MLDVTMRSTNQRQWTLGVIFKGLAIWACCGWSPVAATADDRSDLVQKFGAHVSSFPKFDAEQRTEVQQLLAERSTASAADLITQSLSRLYPEYARAVQQLDDGNADTSIDSLRALAQSDDRFLAADAGFYLARILMNNERFEEALPLLQSTLNELEPFSTHTGDAQFFLGVAHAGLLQNDLAVAAMMEFLEGYPDAAERLRVAAWRQVQQLQSIKQGQMDDVHQRMDFSRRRLEIMEPGDRTQEEQDKIVRMLAQMIKEQEKKECSGSGSNPKSQSQQQQNQQQAQKPQDQSESQQGGMSQIANGKFVDRAFDNGSDSAWSRLRDRSRDPANSAIKDKLPARYRDIVERYMDAVNGSGNQDR